MANTLSFFKSEVLSIRGTHPNGDKLITKPQVNKRSVIKHFKDLERQGFKDLVIMKYTLKFAGNVTEETI